MGIEAEKKIAQPIGAELLEWADEVVIMGNPHLKHIIKNFPQHLDKVTQWDVADPHFQKGEEFHKEVVRKLKELISRHFAPQ